MHDPETFVIGERHRVVQGKNLPEAAKQLDQIPYVVATNLMAYNGYCGREWAFW
jgi:hypothetical protein